MLGYKNGSEDNKNIPEPHLGTERVIDYEEQTYNHNKWHTYICTKTADYIKWRFENI